MAIKFNVFTGKLQFFSGASSTTFLGLTDTPSSYSGQANLYPRVNGAETAIEFVAGTGSGAPTSSQYVTLALDGNLTAERVLTAGTGIGITDGGANGNVTIAISHLGIQDLTDPNADRIIFWDDSETATGWLTVGTGLSITTTTISVDEANVDHGGLGGLSDDDHTQYVLLLGRSGGQTIIGGTGVGDDLTLQTTSNASKGSYILSELTTNGFVKTSGGTGTLSVSASIDISSDTNLAVTSPITLTGDTVGLDESSIDHGSIGGLTDDDHTQYLLLAGRSGGQVIHGGTASGNSLTIQSTSNATKGNVIFQETLALQLDPHGTGAGNTMEVRFLELAANGTHYTGFKAPDSLVASVLYVLPNADGSANEFLQTDGSAGLSWAVPDHGALGGLGDDDHTIYILADGTRALTANWDAGSFEIRAQTFQSDVTTGTAPFTVASTTLVTNLNADLLDGVEGSGYLLSTGDTGTGVYDFGGADSFEIPNSATPTVDAAGEVAVDTTITDHTGLMTYHDGVEALYVIAIPTANLTTTNGHVIAYNSTNNEFEMVAQSGGSGEWTDTGTFLHPADLSGAEDVGVGGTTLAGADIILYATGAATFNEQGAAVDFRIEGDTDTDLFFVDGSADKVGVSTNSPATTLDIAGSFKSAVVALSDGANIATDVSLGNVFTVTLGGNRTLDNPTNPQDGQKCIWRLKQDPTGSRTITLGSAFRLNDDITSITLSTGANKLDSFGAIYNSTDSKWDILAFVKGTS